MIKYFQEKFALSYGGAKDLVKAIIACSATNIGMMFPVGLMFLLLRELLPAVSGGAKATPNILVYIGLCVLLLVLLYILQFNQYNKTFLASYIESANKRISLAEKLRKLPLSFFGKRDLSDLTTTIMSDCAGLETAFSHFVPELIGAVVSTVFVGIGLLMMDWKMAIAALWVVPIAFAMTLMAKSSLDKTGRKVKKTNLDVTDSIQECIETVRDIKANNQEKAYMEKLDLKLERQEKDTIWNELKNGIFVSSAQMFLRLGIASVVVVGSQMIINRETDLLTFLVFLIAASRIYDPLSASLINLAAVYNSLLKVERMKEIENQPIQSGKEIASYNGYDVCFDNVDFAYNSNEPVLNNVSFTAKQGEVTALVGPSGGGKSTAAKLAARFWDIKGGKITLGGTDISKVDPEALLANFSIVFQDVMLFNNTVMENIRIGKQGASDKEVLAAARAAQCDDFVLQMPNGYNTVIGENGSTLSGGERQRLSIARALLKDAPVILLDEATASLDVENETLIQSALSNLIKNKTVIVIAHRMRTIASADKIVVLENGMVAEQGTHDSLISKNGLYNRLWTAQNKASEWSLSAL